MAIVFLGLIIYSNTFHVPFQFDDSFNISEKPYVRDISAFFDSAKIELYRPDHSFRMRTVGYFTFAVNYRIHGNDVVGYHIVNILIHTLNGFLVYFLVLLTLRTPYFSRQYAVSSQESGEKSEQSEVRMKKPTAYSLLPTPYSRFIPFAVALLFVSHPIQTQAVTYIVQRLASLATLFYLLSLVMYIKWRLISQNTEYRIQNTEKRQKVFNLKSVIWYLSSVVSAVLAMKTKEIAFTLPLLITLYEFMFFEGTLKRRIFYLLPILLTLFIIPVSLIGSTKPLGEIIGDVSESTRVQTDISRWDYFFTQFRVIVTYIRLLFFPVNQNLDYDYPVYNSFFDPNVFLSFLFLLLILGIAAYLLYASHRLKPAATPYFRLIAFGIFWFFITPSVESSIIPITDVIFEHRLYLPSVGAFVAVTAVLSMVWERVKEKGRWAEKTSAGVLLVVVIILSGATYARNTVWQIELSLWKDVLQKSPAKVRAHNNLGLAFMHQGDVDKAEDAYARAIALNSNVAEPHYNMGRVYEKRGQYDKAIEEYKKAVYLKPDFADAFFDLGVAYASKGMREEAIMHYRAALRLKPDFAKAHFNMGVIYLAKNLVKEARDEFESALRSDPTLHQARQFLEYIHRLQ